MKPLVKISSIFVVIFSLLLLLPQFLEAKSAKNNPGLVNINSADLKGMTSLPGIGKSTAERIIQYRTDHGKFKKKEELTNVKGIGTKKFEKIKDLIVLSDDEIAQAKQK